MVKRMSKHDLDSNTKTHGFTAWINMRLTPFDLQLSDVFEELLNDQLGYSESAILDDQLGFFHDSMKKFCLRCL